MSYPQTLIGLALLFFLLGGIVGFSSHNTIEKTFTGQAVVETDELVSIHPSDPTVGSCIKTAYEYDHPGYSGAGNFDDYVPSIAAAELLTSCIKSQP